MMEHKKEQILRLVPLGIGLDRAYLIAECSFKEIEKLNNDAKFQAEIHLEEALEEKRLLEAHMYACEISAKHGTTTGLQWKLSKLYPDKWGQNVKEDKSKDSGIKTQVYLPENGR